MLPIARFSCYYIALLLVLLPLRVDAEALKPELRITGADPALAENVSAHVNIAQENCATPRLRLGRLQRKAQEESQAAARALGYYQATIHTEIAETENCWALKINIEPGPTIRIASVRVEFLDAATHDTELIGVTAQLPVKSDQILNHALYEESKKLITNAALDRGYFDGRFKENQLAVDVENRRAYIVLIYASGPRYRFGELRFIQDTFSENFLRRFADFSAGDNYDSAQLLAFQQRLSDSGYFADINVRPLIDQAQDQHIPLHIQLQPRPQYAFSSGIGASTDSGPRLRFDFENRRTGRHGRRFNSHFLWSSVRTEISSAYTLPLANPASEHLILQAGYAQEDTDTSRLDTSSLGISRSAQRGVHWLETLSLSAQREDFAVATRRGDSDLVIVGAHWLKLQSDHSLHTEQGQRLSYELRAANEDFFSDSDFLQAKADFKWINAFIGGRILTHIEIGATAVDDISDLPASLRFFSGGDRSVRGYAYKSLGPLNTDGEITGGRYLFNAGLEYDWRIAKAWRLAFFYDTGNAFNDAHQAKLKQSAGFGLRWLTPIAPVRLDFAFPLGDESADKLRLHLTMGPDL